MTKKDEIDMTVQDAMRALGAVSKAELGRKLGASKQSVSHWAKVNRLPYGRAYQVRLLALDAAIKAGVQ